MAYGYMLYDVYNIRIITMYSKDYRSQQGGFIRLIVPTGHHGAPPLCAPNVIINLIYSISQ